MNFEFLSRTFLFQGTSPEETQHMLSCLNAEPKNYPKGSVICQVGEQMKAMGLVLSGSVHIESIDMMGNKTILNRIAPGQVFGETYACIPGEKLLVGVTAAEDCQILFLEVGKSIRGRLISYFSQEMVQQGSSRFIIPFNRQELADYLGVDRSALSNELGKMRKEGMIEVNRNQIHYLEQED